jgi:eukaryotic-like serine/threonine-protein kinase
MVVTPGVVRGLRGGTSALDLDTEGGRAFLQQRVAFFNKVAFCISGAFFVVAAFVGPYYGDPRPPLLHAATLVVSLAAWLVCGRGPSLSAGLLAVIDAAAVALVLVGFAAQALVVPPAFAGEVAQSLVLILTHMAIVRAVVVPSTAAHSAGVSLLAALPVLAAVLRLPSPPGAAPVVAWNDRLWSGLWTVCAIVVAALVSHVIYGLRVEIQKARHLGQYSLEEKLGEGGMGSVYRARHAMLRRPTAIKLVPPEKASASALARFEREVQLTASLSHPNTVSVFDYGHTPDGIFYYAMEYLEGTDLDALVREDGPQPPARVAHVLRQVASALVEAHGIGLIHRDIKPENIILCERGGIPDVAKVVDFGLVRDLEPASGARLTQANVLQGTPLYLSPEAIRAPDAVDARSDLYGLGAVGYYLLTGTHVFGGATTVEVCSHHLHSAPVPPSERLQRPVPAGLERLILACLEKEPERRPGSAADLRDALGDLDDVGSWSEREAREWWERWHRSRGERPHDVAARPSRTLDVALGRRSGGA